MSKEAYNNPNIYREPEKMPLMDKVLMGATLGAVAFVILLAKLRNEAFYQDKTPWEIVTSLATKFWEFFF